MFEVPFEFNSNKIHRLDIKIICFTTHQRELKFYLVWRISFSAYFHLSLEYKIKLNTLTGRFLSMIKLIAFVAIDICIWLNKLYIFLPIHEVRLIIICNWIFTLVIHICIHYKDRKSIYFYLRQLLLQLQHIFNIVKEIIINRHTLLHSDDNPSDARQKQDNVLYVRYVYMLKKSQNVLYAFMCTQVYG